MPDFDVRKWRDARTPQGYIPSVVLEPATLHRALCARDPRFDGLFFVGVKTTGVFCRAICPARTPLLRNCRFFGTALEAQTAGFRPCLRCRPEAAPGPGPAGTPLSDQLVQLIRTEAVGGGTLREVERRSGFSARQFRRRVVAAAGMRPVEILQSERLLFARRLLRETGLSVTQIALGSGFQSVRRFNALFRQRYGEAPSAFRGAPPAPSPAGITLQLSFRPPLDWPGLVRWLGARATRGVEQVGADLSWARTVRLKGHSGWVHVRPDPQRPVLHAQIASTLAPVLGPVVQRLRALLDLDADPERWQRAFAGDPLLGPLARRHPGLRLAGAWDPFEWGVRTILGQQVSVAAASTLAGRLTERFAEPFSEAPWHGLQRHALTPERLAGCRVAEIAAVGLPRSRAKTLLALARFTLAGGWSPRPDDTHDAVRARLREVEGMGPWTLEHVALRALRHPDAFPSGDLGLRKALANGALPTAAEVESRSAVWRPWRGYAAALLWRSLETPNT